MKPNPLTEKVAMTHDELVEKVARALVRHSWQGSSLVDGNAMADSGDFDEDYRDVARVAVSAVLRAQRQSTADLILWIETLPREPTPALRKAFAEYQAIVEADASLIAQGK